MRKILIFLKDHIWVLGLIAAIVTAVYIGDTKYFRSKAGPGPASLVIVPQMQNIGINQNGSFSVVLNPNGAEVSSVELFIEYSSNVIEIQNITPGDFFTNVTNNPQVIVNNIQGGLIHYVVGFPLGSGSSSSASGKVAEITFLTKSEGYSQIQMYSDNNRDIYVPQTIIADKNANNVLGTTYSGQITVVGGARLYFSDLSPQNPQSSKSTFTVQNLLDTGGQNVSALDAVITFDPRILSVVDLDRGSEPKLVNYPTLNYDNTAGRVNISANIGNGQSITPLNGGNINFGSITFQVKQQTTGTDINYSYTPGSRNDSNIVLWNADQDILSQISSQNITTSLSAGSLTPTPTSGDNQNQPPRIKEPRVTYTPTSSPTSVSPTPSITINPSPTPVITPTPTGKKSVLSLTSESMEGFQNIDLRLGLQGKNSDKLNGKVIYLKYQTNEKNVELIENVVNAKGEFSTKLPVEIKNLLVDAEGYLARKYPISIIQGNQYLDISSSPLLGGDFNNDGIINEIDYSVYFLPSFSTDNALYDLDGSGQVNSLDYEIIRKNWYLVDDSL